MGNVASLLAYLVQFTCLSLSGRNCMDWEAWLELSELYLSLLDYEKAAFCVEELILHNPNNHLYHQRYAEVRTGTITSNNSG